METAVVGVGGHSVDCCHRVEAPWRKDEQAAVSAGLKPRPLGFPIGGDGLFLDMDEGIAVVETFVFHHQFAMRDAGGDHHRGSTEDGINPLLMLAGIVGRVLVGFPRDGMQAVALHLYLAWPPQQEQIAESAIVSSSNSRRTEGAAHGPPGCSTPGAAAWTWNG